MAIIVGCTSQNKLCHRYLLTHFTDGGIFDSDPYREEIIAFTTKKQLVPEAHQIFLRAIGCNWLVCLSCFLGVQAKDLTSKVVGMWIPIFAFVALGFDHVVANMFFMPLGIWMGTPGLTIGLYIWKGKLSTYSTTHENDD
jgi:formate/nitrite transporter FocA (FNT family)